MSDKIPRALLAALAAALVVMGAGFASGWRIPLGVCGQMPCDLRGSVCLPCPEPGDVTVKDMEGVSP